MSQDKDLVFTQPFSGCPGGEADQSTPVDLRVRFDAAMKVVRAAEMLATRMAVARMLPNPAVFEGAKADFAALEKAITDNEAIYDPEED